MKVLFLTNIPSPYRVDFFNRLGEECDLTVLYERKQASDRNFKWESKKYRNFNEFFLKGIKFRQDSALCVSVLKYLTVKKYDIFIISGYSTPTGMLAIEYLSAKKIPFILSADGGIIKNESYINKAIKKHFISKAQVWLSTGKKTNEYLLNYGAKEIDIFEYPFTSIKDQDIIDNVLTKNTKSIIRGKLGIKEEKVILSVGQFIYRKGFDVLIKACEMMDKKTGIYIIGGIPTKEYTILVNELGLSNVHFLEFKTKEELNDYYKAADLFVLPTREDIWGLVINEAMANGLSVVTTDNCVAGLELIKNNENGYIVQTENIEQLAEKANLILINSKLNEKMAKNNIETIRNYTIESMAKKHIEILEKVEERWNGKTT